MIYYNDSPPMGMFNRFMNDRCLEETAAFIAREAQEHAHEWEMPSVTAENKADAKLAYIRLAKSRALYVSGDTLFFCCTFDCGFVPKAGHIPTDGHIPAADRFSTAGLFPTSGFTDADVNTDVSTDDAEETALDVIGRILFHPPGTKKYDLTFDEIHANYQYPREDKNWKVDFPGVPVSQMLHPAFGFNEEQRHKILEKEAERFLRRYCPNALSCVAPVPLRRIAEEKMGLRVFTGYKFPEREDSLGVTVFQTQRITVEDEDTGEQAELRFPRGSVIIDADTILNRGFGSFNFTLAHELYHWYAHRVHMAFMDLMGRPDDYATVKGHLESQANGVGARILMPRGAVIRKYTEAVEEFSDREGNADLQADGAADSADSDADVHELAVTECAAFFGASKTAMKIRLHELGLHEETRKPTVRRRLDIVEMFTQYASDKTFRLLLDSGAYRYVKGYVVRNEPKYVTDDGLTEYAREHPAECIMTFHEEYQKHDETPDNLLFRKDEYFSRRADYDMRMKENPKLMETLAMKLAIMKKAYIESMDEEETFCTYMMPIITDLNTKYMGLDVKDDMDDGLKAGKLILKPDKRIRNRYYEYRDFQTGEVERVTEPKVFQNKTLVHYKMFEKMRRNKWDKIELEMVMAVCVGYHLDMETTEKALLRAGYLLLPGNPTHLVYRFLVSHCRDLYSDTGTFNTLLILLGEKEIGTNKHKEKSGQSDN